MVSVDRVKELFKFRIEDYKQFLTELKPDDPDTPLRKEVYEHTIREYELLPFFLDEMVSR
jgi:hypothetical protein